MDGFSTDMRPDGLPHAPHTLPVAARMGETQGEVEIGVVQRL